MTIVLHIGVSKTGSSAIQYALAMHREALSRRGLHYAVEGAEELVEKRLITSGNGAHLTRRLNPRRGSSRESEALDFDRAYVSPDQAISLVSSEGLSSADPELLQRFKDEVIGGREVRIIAFVRDVYGHAVASWMQRIKRHGYTGRLEAFCAKSYDNKQHQALRTYEAVFGRDRISVLHYDSVQDGVFHAFMGALGIEAADLAAPPKVNRSLTRAEVEVLIACNHIHKGMQGLSARISDHLIYKHPDRRAHGFGSARAAAILSERFQGEVDWINQAYFDGRPVLTTGRPVETPGEEPGPEEIWADAVEALGRRLISVEAHNRTLQATVDTIPDLVRQRDLLREELARLRKADVTETLKLALARAVRRARRGAGAQD